MNESLKIEGKYRLQIFKDGVCQSDETVKNLVTNAGKAQIALLIGDSTAIPFLYLAVGTSTTAVAVTDTTLTAEITDTGLARAAGTVSRTTTTVTNDTYQITKTWTASGTKTVEEIGVLTASSGGVLLSHALTGSKALTNGAELVATYTLKIS